MYFVDETFFCYKQSVVFRLIALVLYAGAVLNDVFYDAVQKDVVRRHTLSMTSETRRSMFPSFLLTIESGNHCTLH